MSYQRYDCFSELLHTGIGITDNGKELTGLDVINLLNSYDYKLRQPEPVNEAKSTTIMFYEEDWEKMKVKDTLSFENIFGDLTKKVIWSNNPLLAEKDIIMITNSNCEFEYDSIERKFREGLMYGFIVELELISVDLTGYVPEKSDNGGGYAYAECKVLKIIEQGY